MMSRIIVLDKQPRVISVGIGGIVNCFLKNPVMKMAGEEATHVYGKGHICGRVVAGIKGRIHVMFIFIVVPEIH